MKFEHFALNVPDVQAHVAWFVKNLEFTIARQLPDPPYMHVLADETGRIIIELYSNKDFAVHDFAAAHPMLFHIAFQTPDARAVRARLEKAGATPCSENVLPDGTVLIMMRDPWHVPLQFCQRAKPFPMP